MNYYSLFFSLFSKIPVQLVLMLAADCQSACHLVSVDYSQCMSPDETNRGVCSNASILRQALFAIQSPIIN